MNTELAQQLLSLAGWDGCSVLGSLLWTQVNDTPKRGQTGLGIKKWALKSWDCLILKKKTKGVGNEVKGQPLAH